MQDKNFSLTLLADQSPGQVFKAVSNIREWWSGYYEEEITGKSDQLHDEFIFRAGGGAHYSKQKLIELIPNKKIVWQVIDSKLLFLENKEEWTGTRLVFEISTKGNKTQLVFTHEGLTPGVECFNACSPAWRQYLQNKLSPLINDNKSTGS
jgi:hypothetical protein